MIDVVGHFGSQLSFATVSQQVVLGLLKHDALGSITNLDDKFLSEELAHRVARPRGAKVIVVSDPRDHLVDALVGEYGWENVALFVCPNTDRLGAERIRSCRKVGRIYTPSYYCFDAITDALNEKGPLGSSRVRSAEAYVMALGVDEEFANNRRERVGKRSGEARSYLHVTTDTFWPGRKGTEQLIEAWKIAREIDGSASSLTIHCLTSLYPTVYQELGDHGLVDDVTLIAGPTRGSTSAELLELFKRHDILVAPSRSEGFGIMPLSALASGMPVLTTAGTGQDEYLYGDLPLSGWMQLPTAGVGSLNGEEGYAPVVHVDQLALSLVASRPLVDVLAAEAGYGKADDDEEPRQIGARWSWSARREEWAQSLIEWSKEEA